MIDDPALIERLWRQFPGLANCEDDFRHRLLQQARRVALPAHTAVCHEGQSCEMLPLVMQGQVRVFKLSQNGREITLYRIVDGDSCVLTTSCLMSGQNFPAMASTETETEALLLPGAFVVEAISYSAAWRKFVFGLIASRLGDIISVVDEVAFHRLDQRLYEWLYRRSETQTDIAITHQELAQELGSSREVVTRLLRDLVGRQWVELSRGHIKILQRDALQQLLLGANASA